jgi:glycosyltransferase involved in cell wall biosynthesis
MKILHVETGRHFYGGAQQVVWLVDGLSARGVRCKLVCPPGSGIDREARDVGIDVLNLSCAGDLDVTFAWRLYKLLQREMPDLLHCHSRRGADFLGGQAAAVAGVPAVVSRRVDSSEGGAVSALRYQPYRQVIAISEHIADTLLAAGMRGKRLTVIRSAVDARNLAAHADRTVLQREFGILPGEFTIAIVAQLIPRKGHKYLFDALADPALATRNIRLVVFGEGALASELRARIKRLNLDNRVLQAGFRCDLDALLPAFDLLVHPAIHEGLGVAMLKAAAAGLPVIAFDAAGAREAVQHDVTGLLVATKDVAALRDAIIRLIDDPPLRETFGRAGRQRMLDEFSVQQMIEQHLQLYREAIVG